MNYLEVAELLIAKPAFAVFRRSQCPVTSSFAARQLRGFSLSSTQPAGSQPEHDGRRLDMTHLVPVCDQEGVLPTHVGWMYTLMSCARKHVRLGVHVYSHELYSNCFCFLLIKDLSLTFITTLTPIFDLACTNGIVRRKSVRGISSHLFLIVTNSIKGRKKREEQVHIVSTAINSGNFFMRTRCMIGLSAHMFL